MDKPLFPDVVVNGEKLPPAMIAAEAQNHPAPKGKPGLAWRRAAQALVTRSLLLQEARARSVNVDPLSLGDGKRESEEDAQIRGLLADALKVDRPTEEVIHSEWNKDPDRFRAPPLWEVSHILIACDPDDETALTKAHQRAERLAQEIAADPAKFGDIARSQSDCPSKSTGGWLGQIRPGDTVPPFEAALRGMQEGEMTPAPVATQHGLHLIRVDAFAKGDSLPFASVRDKISEAIEKAAWAHAARDFVDSLVGAADITGVDMARAHTGAADTNGMSQ